MDTETTTARIRALNDAFRKTLDPTLGRAVLTAGVNALPNDVRATLEVVDTEPVTKGQTASSSYKPAVLSNGVRTTVPPHIVPGTRMVEHAMMRLRRIGLAQTIGGELHRLHEGGRKDVEFNNAGGVAVAGILGGVVLGLGASYLALAYGAVLGPKIQTIMVIVGLSLGGLVALTSAFFGLVIPRHVSREPKDWGCCKGKNE